LGDSKARRAMVTEKPEVEGGRETRKRDWTSIVDLKLG